MSRRYGRNQRRQAREALATAEAEIQSLKRRLAWTKADLQRESRQRQVFETQIKACSEALGMSIAVPPKEVNVGSFADVASAGFRMEALTKPLHLTVLDGPAEVATAAVTSYTMDVIEAHLELHGYGPIGKQPHAMLTVNGQKAYAVRLQDLSELLREEGIQRIANLLAAEFIDTLKRVGAWRR